jgi:hypothetical protein
MLPKMTDVEIVERTISQLTDKRDRVVARSTEIAAERQLFRKFGLNPTAGYRDFGQSE